MVAGMFDLDGMITLGFDRIKASLEKIHKYLGILVGDASAHTDVHLAASPTKKDQNSQMTFQSIAIRPSTYVVSWFPWSIEYLPRE